MDMTYKTFKPCLGPPNPPRHIEWYLLIRAMEGFRGRTGHGLGLVWGYVNSGDYDAARDEFIGARDRWLS